MVLLCVQQVGVEMEHIKIVELKLKEAFQALAPPFEK